MPLFSIDADSAWVRLLRTAAGICLILLCTLPQQLKAESPNNGFFSDAFTLDSFKIEDSSVADPPSRIENEAIVRGNFTEFSIENPYKWRAVGRLYGEWENFDGSSSGNGFSSDIFSGSVGADRKIGSNVLAGLHFEAADISADSKNNQTHVGVSSFSGLARLGLFGDRWYWNLSCGIGQNRSRDWNIFLPQQYKTSQTQWTYSTEIGVKIRSGYTKIEPFLGFRYTNLTDGNNDLKEKTGLFSDDSGQSYRTYLGSRFSWDYATFIARLRPSIWGMWAHEFGDASFFSAGDTTDMPVLWRFADQRMPRDRAIIGAGIAAALRNKIDLWLHYNTDFSGHYQAYSLAGGVNIKY